VVALLWAHNNRSRNYNINPFFPLEVGPTHNGRAARSSNLALATGSTAKYLRLLHLNVKFIEAFARHCLCIRVILQATRTAAFK